MIYMELSTGQGKETWKASERKLREEKEKMGWDKRLRIFTATYSECSALFLQQSSN
jgi:hypothetical protein